MPVFYLIRHAESVGNQKPHLICGRSNHYLLSAKGITQAEQIAQRLKKENVQFNYLFTSPAERTIQTAAIIESTLLLPKAVVSDDLQEQWMGNWEGELRAKIYTNEIIQYMSADNWHFKSHNGESQFDVENRMYRFLERLISLPPEVQIGIVTHGMAIKCLLRKILNSSPAMTHKIRLDNASLTILRYDHSEWYLDRVNDSAHLLSPVI